MKKSFLALVAFPLIFSGCSSVPPICKPENAREAGISQAMRGESYNESAGGVCEEEHRNHFKTNFQAGYQEGKARYCNPATVQATGLATGQAGNKADFTEASYAICDSTTGLRSSYQSGYQAGLEQFCDPEKARANGQSFGESGRPNEFSEASYAVCSASKLNKIKSAYADGHRKGLNTFCMGTSADAQGLEDGTSGKDPADVSGKFQICGNERLRKVTKIYQEAFSRGFAKFCSGENITQKAREQAKTSATSAFPQEFQKCLNKYPELNIQFSSVFREERRRVVESMCTYQSGLAQGQKDGESRNDKATGMPEFCDAQFFSIYLSGYMEGWKQTKDRLCNATEAYKQGVQAGMSGQPLSYSPPGSCPPDYQQQLHSKFTEGYYYGVSQKPSQLGQVGGTAIGQRQCRSSVDCPSGAFCRDRGDGLTLCMGRSVRGQYCRSTLDCQSGLTCRNLPADPRFKVCQ